MTKHRFFFWHLGYLTIIAVLIGYIVKRHFRDKELLHFVHLTAVDAEKKTAEFRHDMFNEISRRKEVLPSAKNRALYVQAGHADSLRQFVQEAIRACIQTSNEPGLRNTQRSIIMPVSPEKIAGLQQAADSLGRFYGILLPDEGANPYSLDIMGDMSGRPGWLARYLYAARANESLLALDVLRLRAGLAEQAVLKQILSKMPVGQRDKTAPDEGMQGYSF